MKIGILVAMEEEMKRLMESLTSYESYELANQRFYDGYIGDKAVCIVQAGIGKVNAALASSLLIQHFNVEQIINTGSAGAIQEGLKIGDLVISDKLTYHDADNRAFGYRYGQIPQMPEIYEADQDLNKEVSAIAEKQQWKIHNGLIVTGDSFVSSAEEIQRIRKHFPLALVTEMEGAAVAQSCYQYNIPCVVIRAVSDTADGEATIDFDDFVLLAGKRSAELVLALIKNIG